jgi:hypothetical protein
MKEHLSISDDFSQFATVKNPGCDIKSYNSNDLIPKSNRCIDKSAYHWEQKVLRYFQKSIHLKL